jgi:hypothetical protein
MKCINPKESLLNEALAANWPIPDFTHQPDTPATNRIDSPLLLKALLDGGFTSKAISPANAIIPQLTKLSGNLDLSPRLLNRLLLLDILYEQLKTQAHFDPAVMILFYKLRPSIIRAVLGDDDLFIKSSKHPLRKALDELCTVSIGWESSLEKNGARYFTQLGKLVSAISTIVLSGKLSASTYEAELQTLHEISSRYDQNTQRLCQSEHGLMESKKNNRLADEAINGSTENIQLPPHTIHFLHGPWRDALLRILALHGHNSKDWSSATQLMGKLVFCMSPSNDELEKQQKYKMVVTLRSSLEKHLLGTGNNAEQSHWIDEIESQLQLIFTGSTIALESAPRLTSVVVDGVTACVSSAISQQIAELSPGQWVLYKTEGGEITRAKLAMIDNEAKQLLFVNLMGAKRFSKNAEEFGYALNSKKIQLLTTNNLFSLHLTKAVEFFIKRHQQYKMQSAGTNTLSAQETLKRQSAEKALAEAQKLQALEKECLKPALPPKEIKTSSSAVEIKPVLSLHPDDQQRIEAEVSSLEIGSWLSMQNRLGELMPCKIAVIYASTGKMIIVDKCGMRVGEFLRPELTQLIMQGKASILEKSDSFESSLARVIQTLRKDS